MVAFIETYGLVVIIGGLLLWQLATGKAMTRIIGRSVSRAENPVYYWTQIAITVAVLGFASSTATTEPPPTASVTATAATSEDVAASAPLTRKQEAYNLHNAGRYAEAIAIYDSLLGHETSAELLMFRGVAHWRLKHNDIALQDFRRVAAMDDTNFTASQYADRILSEQKRWDEVLSVWSEFIRKNPARAQAYYERGGTNFHKGDMAAAAADAAKACELGNAAGCSQAARLRTR